MFIRFIESTHKDKSKTFRNIHEVAAHTLCLQSTFVINQEILTFVLFFLVFFNRSKNRFYFKSCFDIYNFIL